MVLAFAISIALHEAAAGLIPPQPVTRSSPEIVTNAHVLPVALRATPSPRPPPTPPPLRSIPVSALARPRLQPGSRLAPRASPKRAGEALQPRNARPVWDAAGGKAVAATAIGAGGGAAATGNGLGVRGNGNGTASGDEPCGFVTFSDPHGSRFDARTRGFYVDIRMSVHFADGTSQSVILDYPWYYASEAANPWSDQNLKDPAFPTRFQPPPVDKSPNEPPLVQYVAAHSTTDGMTLLRDCPQSEAPPAPSSND